MSYNKKYYVIDHYFKHFYGPYTNKKEANKIRSIVRVIPDMFLEITTNVSIETNIPLGFEEGNLECVKKSNESLLNK